MNEILDFVRSAEQRLELSVRVDRDYHCGMIDRVVVAVTRCFFEKDAKAIGQFE
jgi:hypothetical protein